MTDIGGRTRRTIDPDGQARADPARTARPLTDRQTARRTEPSGPVGQADDPIDQLTTARTLTDPMTDPAMAQLLIDDQLVMAYCVIGQTDPVCEPAQLNPLT